MPQLILANMRKIQIPIDYPLIIHCEEIDNENR